MIPYRSVAEERYAAGLVRQQRHGVVRLIPDREWWLDYINDTITKNASTDNAGPDKPPIFCRIGKFARIFGDNLAEALLTDLNRNLTV